MPTNAARVHLNWCAARALECFDANDKKGAFASFLSDVTKDPGTAWIVDNPGLTFMLMEDGWSGGRERFKRALEGFTVFD